MDSSAKQQAILSEWHQYLERTGQQASQILQQAHTGCQGLISSNPSDPTPLCNALSAVGQRIEDLRKAVEDTFHSHVLGQLELTSNAEQVEEQATQRREEMETWLEETWERFAAQWRWEACRALWPLASRALQRPTPCNRCGAALTRATPHQSETVQCQHCGSVNQTSPDAAVARYYGMAPDAYAHLQSLDSWFAVTRYRLQVEVARRGHHLRTSDWIDEPIESLKRWEQLEHEHWSAYARARAQVLPSTPEAAKELVDSRMKPFYEEMLRNEIWRAANGMPPLHAAVPYDDNAPPEYGSLRPDQVEEFFYQDALIEDARPDPAKLQQVLARFGYRDQVHYERVKRTFLSHHEDACGEEWFQAQVNQGVMRAMKDRMVGTIEASGHLFEPVEGVSFEQYSALTASQGRDTPEQFLRVLAQHNLDRAKFDRVAAVFMDRMSKDTTGAMATKFAEAWSSAGTGAYADAARAGMSAMGPGGLATSGPSGPEPVSLERYAEMSGAMSAWSRQGKDISAMLNQAFQMTAQDISQIGMYWSARMTSDMSLMDRMSALTTHFEQVYLGQKPAGSPLPQPGPDGKYLVNSQTRELTPVEQEIYRYLSARDYNTANAMLRDLLAREPTNPVALALRSFALGNLRMALGPGPQLDAVYQEQVAHAPIVLANLARDRIDTSVPVGQVQMAALVEAHAIVARDILVRARSPEEVSQAGSIAEDGLELKGDHAELLRIRCLALFREGDDEEAMEVMARIMTLPPDEAFMREVAPYVTRARQAAHDDD